MQHLEQYFGVPLFTRGKNRIELNETGKLAVAAARKLLQEAELAASRLASCSPVSALHIGQRHRAFVTM